MLHAPERDGGPLGGTAAGRRFIEIVEQSLAVVCCLLGRDKLIECENEEIVEANACGGKPGSHGRKVMLLSHV